MFDNLRKHKWECKEAQVRMSLVPPEQMSNMFMLFRLPQVTLHYAAKSFGKCGSRTCEIDADE